jgi:hypothetical protein
MKITGWHVAALGLAVLFCAASSVRAAGSSSAESAEGAMSVEATESAESKVDNCAKPALKKSASADSKKTAEHPSISQTVYCGSTTMSPESTDTGAGAKERGGGEKSGIGDQSKAAPPAPPPDAGNDKPAVGDTSFEFAFKDIHVAAKSPNKGFVVLAAVVALIALIATAIFLARRKPAGTAVSGLFLVVGVALASYWLGQWTTSKSCADEVKATVEQRGLNALQTDVIASMTRTLSEENARLRQELGSLRTELYVIQNTPHPPPSWVLAFATGLAGLAVGLLPFSLIGVQQWRVSQVRASRNRDWKTEDYLAHIRRLLRDREVERLRELIDELERRRGKSP